MNSAPSQQAMVLESERWLTEAKPKETQCCTTFSNGRYWDRTSDNLLARETVKLKAEIDKTFKSLARPLCTTGL